MPSISAWPGRPPRRRSLSSHSQVSAQRPSSGNAKRASPVALVARPVSLVEHREGGSRRAARCGRPTARIGRAKRQPRPAQVPAHGARQHQRQQHVDLRARAARMAALAVVQRQVDRLVDDVLDDLPALEVGLGGLVQGVDARQVRSSAPWRADATRHHCGRGTAVWPATRRPAALRCTGRRRRRCGTLETAAQIGVSAAFHRVALLGMRKGGRLAPAALGVGVACPVDQRCSRTCRKAKKRTCSVWMCVARTPQGLIRALMTRP